MKKRAFTLIELLVVIAIIAILAAILFPVFAQAKAAAKATASLSNDKQENLAIIMYASDMDDMSPIDCTWGASDAYYWFGTAGSQFSPWTYECLPYTKNGGIYQDPQIQSESTVVGIPPQVTWSYWPQYGLNYTALSPITDTTTTWKRSPIKLTSLSRPAETVMVSAHHKDNESIGWYWWGAGTLLISPYTVEAPDCYDIAPLCMDNWGHGWYADTWLEGNYTAGAQTGFNSLRKAGNAIVGFVDGHVKTYAPGNLAAGTNWYNGINDSALHMINSSVYLWGNYQ